MSQAAHQEWWTADQLAASGLPDVPTTKRAVNMMVARLDWHAQPGLARRRSGRGGGWEYSWRLLPTRAQAALLRAVAAEAPAKPERMERADAWSWYDAQPEKTKIEAVRRLTILQRVASFEGPLGRHLAVVEVSRLDKLSERTIWNWLSMIEGVDPADLLPYLAPRHRAAKPQRKRAECSAEFLDWLKSDFLRLGEPSFASCWHRISKHCERKGLAFLTLKTAQRWMDENVPRVTQVFARQGERGLAKCFPPQVRDRSMMTAMEGVNADCHKIDVFVQWPGIEKPVRPQIIGFQDLYSGKILSWRVDLDPNKVAVMSAFGELIETWGIPRDCLFDNGHEFANKWLTGGTPTRFRFKVRKDDPLGVLPMMGIKVHWATPAHGQAKPIERGFRDFADHIALHPAFAGAYVGNNTLAKPEDYGSRAVPLEDFLRVLAEGIRDHNARPGRMSANAKGRSFDQTFAESYQRDKVRKATAEQRRLWLMGQEVRKLHSGHGSLKLHDNGYHADWMSEFAGQEVVARFDPEDLHAGLYIYSLQGEFLGEAPCREKVGFFDLVGAKLHARQKAQRRRIEKRLLDAHRPVSVSELAAELARKPAPLPEELEAKVVQMVPMQARGPLVTRQLPVPDTSRDEDLNKVLQVPFRPSRAEPGDTDASRFWRVLDIERRSEAGETVTMEEHDFWRRMQAHPAYRAQRAMYDRDGEVAIG
ncbi:transposase domain-containing protein [Tabrizicola fusiformis]|uniref:transposase domain-containing protein n=1 Tax=Tabrizicola sp. SY72 TaxID=2741673 RepID=UPI0015725598|nr:transposase domain-containing protein [Tabrizicola sp. SY72]NTT88538.1 Mu transposase C-terminal domain-containing protein [Tabrizicola sp. SY72]